MATMLGIPAGPSSKSRSIAGRQQAAVSRIDSRNTGFLEGELLDLYGAICIVVPVALFLKSFWL